MAGRSGDDERGAGASSSTRRSANVQRLMDNADQSLSLLVSMGDVPGAPRSTGLGLEPDASAAMSTDSFHFSQDGDGDSDAVLGLSGLSGLSRSGAALSASSGLAEPVVGASVRPGLLHVKGVFPDHSVEFADVDPRFTTVGELKRALCERRAAHAELGLPTRDARVLFGGQLVEDDWLVVDCGMGFDGALHIVRAASAAATGWNGPQPPRQDPKLSISSIASVYAPSQAADAEHAPADPTMLQLSALSQALSLDARPQVAAARGELLSRHVRPEEATFADMATDFYANLDRVQDSDAYCEKLLRGYIDALQTRLETLEASLAASSKARSATAALRRLREDVKELRDERNTWRLLFELRQVCHATSTRKTSDEHAEHALTEPTTALRFEMLEDDALRLLETRRESFQVQRAVKRWLEHMALEHTVAVSDQRGASGSRTLQLLRRGRLAGEDAVRMDPDAVLRDGDGHVLADDSEDEAELLQAVWLFIRAGKTSDAVDLCIRLGQSWRAASLTGGTPVGASESTEREDLALDRWGNPLRALWKTTCWRLSELETPSKLGKSSSRLAKQYEQLIYAALSGNVAVVTQSALCESWEDHCWAYLQAMTEQQQDETLCRLLKAKLQSSQLVAGNTPQYLLQYAQLLDKTASLKRYETDLDALFDELRGSPSELVRVQASEPHRHIQAKLVTAQFEYIVSSILDTLLFQREDDAYNWDLQLDARLQADATSPLFLRFAAHFVLLAGFTGESFDEQAGHMILKLYIRHLVKHRQLQLVPVYASRLPTAGAMDIYVQLLATVDDSLERELCVKRILDFAGMDVLSTVLQTLVARLGEQLRSSAMHQQTHGDLPLASDVPTTAVDRRRMRTLEFLCLYCEHRGEALVRANVLAREFILEGKLAAVKELLEEHVPEDSMGVLSMHRGVQLLRERDEMERATREFLCWRAYIQASTQYEQWRDCVVTAKPEALALYSEEKDFLPDLMFHVSRAGAATLEALHFEDGWLLGCSDDAAQDAAIRACCLPKLVFNLHYLQLESAKLVMRLAQYPEYAKAELAQPLLEKSLEVADVVADDHYAVYKALTQEQCRDLLHGFRESAVALTFVESLVAEAAVSADSH